MYLPEKYKKFSNTYPEIFDIYQELGKKTRETGPLDRKIQDLIKLGIAVGNNSKGAVRSHTRKALESGATKEEIMHTVLMALSTVGFPSMVAASGWVDEVIQKGGK